MVEQQQVKYLKSKHLPVLDKFGNKNFIFKKLNLRNFWLQLIIVFFCKFSKLIVTYFKKFKTQQLLRLKLKNIQSF